MTNEQQNDIIVAIDGHSSCGKSTMAKWLAKETGYRYIDTGAMFRAVTLHTMRKGLWGTDGTEPAISDVERSLGDISIDFNPDNGHTLLCGEDVEQEIRGMEVSSKVSFISTIPAVRTLLLEQQRAMGAQKRVVMDGRDIGTVVFPNAELKVFVTASADVRAERRFKELTAKGEKVSFEEILHNVQERDRIDSSRAVAPLKPAEDAIMLDNSHLSIDEQNEIMLSYFHDTLKKKSLSSRSLSIEIDEGSGFCFGVINAIKHAEKELESGEALQCLGDIVHNNQEVDRLEKKGLKTIDYSKFHALSGSKVLFRAHGEPPAVYEFARKHNITVVDATCPVVLALQRNIKRTFEKTRDIDAQIVIFGKHGHAEVNGLVGQTGGEAIVVQNMDEVSKIDLNRPIMLFSQTTMSIDGFGELISYIETHKGTDVIFQYKDTICRQVSNRMPNIEEFAKKKDWIYFVAGDKSSNGKVLFGHCKAANANSYFISSAEQISEPLPLWVNSVGICGATSTPKWLMEEIAEKVALINNTKQKQAEQ